VKTSLPSQERVVARARLFGHLDRARSGSAVWVSGPPGSGKTTLIASYVAARRLRCQWYRVDAGDADLASFFHDLGAARTRGGSRRLPLFTPEFRGGEVAFSRMFFRALVHRRKAPFVVVLDDLQDARSEAFQAVLREGIDQFPPGGTAILVSRDDPPPSFARLVANGTVSLISGEELRLSRAEALAIARAHAPRRTQAEIVQACERAAGWTAGLVLLVSGAGARVGSPSESTALFDYLAGEVLERVDPEVHRVLVEAAIPPLLPVRLVDRLCSSKRASEIFDRLAKRAYFTVRRGDYESGVFELHPLAREFLLSRGRAELTRDQLRRLRTRAATLLEDAGYAELAIALFAEVQAWDEVARIALALAPGLHATGRIATLEKWLRTLPAEARERQPWLTYWFGLCRLPFDPAGARAELERAYRRFEEADDVRGVFLTWGAVIDTFLFEWADFNQMDEWIDQFEEFRRRHPTPGDPRAEEQVALRMFPALTFHRPDSPLLPPLEVRAREIALDPSASNPMRIAFGYWFLVECALRGEIAWSEAVVRTIAPIARAADVAPLATLSWLSTEAVHYWHAGAPSSAAAAVMHGLALARDTGVHLWDFVLLLQGVNASLAEDDVGRAREFLEAAGRLMRPGDALHRFTFEHERGNVALRAGELDLAVECGRAALGASLATGFPFGEMIGRLMLALAFTALGDPVAARPHLDEARRLGAAMRSSFAEILCELCDAELARRAADLASAREHIGRGFGLSREKHVAPDVWFSRGQLAEFCILALEAEVEPEYARGLIRRLKLEPSGAARDLEEWPWPVQVRVMGPFQASVGGEPLGIRADARRRPLDVLAAIVASGRAEPPEEAVAGSLWPDSEGDMAHHALETALYRLKKALGDVVLHRDRKLSIDARRCWIDAVALESLLAQGSASLERRDVEAARSAALRALRLYRGPFLEGRDEPWVLAARDRLRRRLRRNLLDLGRFGDGAGSAGDMLARAAVADPALAEAARS
jgi:LuxR family transcriptional regulator, maltose regulon positive regulatory protein